MADMELRTNSLRVRFEKGDPEPTDKEIFSFMKEKMMLKCDSLLSMYKEKNELSVIIKFKKEEDAQRALMRLPAIMEFRYNKYQSTKVKLSMANAIIRYVRLFNLPPEVDDQEIHKVMTKYGKVIRMVREKYGEDTGYPIWTSVRGVCIEVKDDAEIPATVLVRNLRARIFYEGLVNKCFQCGSTEHMKAECPQRKSANERLNTAGPSSYSDAVSGAGNWTKKREVAANVDGASQPGTQPSQQDGELRFTTLTAAANTSVAIKPSATTHTSERNTPSADAPSGKTPAINNQAAPSASLVANTNTNEKGVEVEIGKNTNGAKQNNTHTAEHKQPGASTSSTVVSVRTGENSREKKNDNMQTAELKQPSVSTTGVKDEAKQKTKRGRKQATRGKEINLSDSEHSTTESDHHAESVVEAGSVTKGVTTRNKAKQLKRCKVGGTEAEASDVSCLSESKTDDVEMEKEKVDV